MRVSARTGRNTRVSGGPVFWLLFGLFVGPFYLLGWVVKAVVSGFQGTKVRSTGPQVKGPGLRARWADPARRQELLIIGGALLAVVVIVVVGAVMMPRQ